jgi:hypothetical protein
MEYILIGILSIVVWGLRATVMDMYDRLYRIEKALSGCKVLGENGNFKSLLGDDNESI